MSTQSTSSCGPHDMPPPKLDENVKILSRRGVDLIALGTTCLVESLADGNIAKSPLPSDWHDPGAELALEAQIYERMGPHARLVPIISWDPIKAELVMKRMVNGTLSDYLAAHPETAADQRLRWASEAAEGLALLHSVGVVQYDVSPHNVLLDQDLGLKITDFGGSSLDGSRPQVAPGIRYSPPDKAWRRGREVSRSGDLFGLGSVIYFIATGHDPFWDVDSDDVGSKFQKEVFPDLTGVLCGGVVDKCWRGKFKSADEVHAALMAVGTLAG